MPSRRCGSTTAASGGPDTASEHVTAPSARPDTAAESSGPGPHASIAARAVAVGLLLATVAAGLFFLDLGHYPLWDPDEARHAEVGREMAAAHGLARFATPTLAFEPYREKPPGYYWLLALAYRIGGVEERAARAVNATAAVLTVLALYGWAVPRTGIAGALGAGLVVATSAGWFGLARYANLDMTFTACVTAGVLAGLAWLDRPVPRPAPLGPYVAAGAAMLVKGPLGLALVFGPLALAAAIQQPRPGLRELGLVRGALVTAAIAALFYVPAAVLDPGYLHALAATHLRRFAAYAPHSAGLHYYLVWLPLLFLPWTVLAVPGLRRASGTPARRSLVLWAAFVVVLLSLARGKLATYVLPALPPLGLIAGPHLARMVRSGPRGDEARWLRAGGWTIAVLLAAGAAAALVLRRAYPIGMAGQLALAATASVAAGALGTALRRDTLRAVPVIVLGAMLVLYPLAVRVAAPAVSVLHSDRAIARLIARTDVGAAVLAFSGPTGSLTFYMGVPPVRTEDPGLVRDVFARDELAFLVTGHHHFAEIERLLGWRAHLWYATRRRHLYANRPAPR